MGRGATGEATELVVTDGTDARFRALTDKLDMDLAGRYGALQSEYDRHNKTDAGTVAVLLCLEGRPTACGAYRAVDGHTVEIKRVFVPAEHRRRGYARRILGRLEELARSGCFAYAVLETGIKQVEAITLYRAIGYEVIDNYGPYTGNENSVCMRKKL